MAKREMPVCTIKKLPEDQLVLAMETAKAWNPNNEVATDTSSGIILPPNHLALLTGKRWGGDGARLTVGFMEPIQADLRSKILLYLNKWNDFANVEFTWSQTDPILRITRELEGYWSYLGTDNLHIPRGQPTMCLSRFTLRTSEAEYMRVVPHEGGHALGFSHEHSRPEIIEQLDEAKTIALFEREQGWSESMTRAQVLTPPKPGSLTASPVADTSSIMCYWFPGSITKSGKPILGGKTFSQTDKGWAAKVYPKADVPVEVLGEMSVRFDSKTKTAYFKLPSGWRAVKG